MSDTGARRRFARGGARSRTGAKKAGPRLKMPRGIALQAVVSVAVLLMCVLLSSFGGSLSESVRAGLSHALGESVNLSDINENLAILVQGVPVLRDIFREPDVPAVSPETTAPDTTAGTTAPAESTAPATTTAPTTAAAQQGDAEPGRGGGLTALINPDDIPIETEREPLAGSDALDDPLEYIEIDTDGSGYGVVYERVELPVELMSPLDGVVTSPFGARVHPITGDPKSFHHGVDIGAGEGEGIMSAAAGSVSVAGWSDVYGNYIMIDHGGALQTFYAHCLELGVAEGDEVQAGQRIALVGSTGWSTGSHLHFEVRLRGCFLDPLMNAPI